MGFGYKTSWLAVRDSSPEQVATVLGLVDQEPLAWDEGIDRAYERGVYVASPIVGWTLAHGRRHLVQLPYGATDPGFLGWFTELSRQLGDVQFFANERGWGYHGWAHAQDGDVVRAFATNDGAVPLFIGAPTPIERDLGRGVRAWADDWRDWGENEWDDWYTTAPSEQHVVQVASRWSVDPHRIESAQVASPGIYGMPANAG